MDLPGILHPNLLALLPGSVWISDESTGDHSDPGYFSPFDGTEVTLHHDIQTQRRHYGGELESCWRMTFRRWCSTAIRCIGVDLTPGSKCAEGPIGCLASTEGIFTFAALSPYLVDGTNTLSFGVVQVNGWSCMALISREA